MQMLNLIVRNLDPETTKEEFDELFGNFGSIRSSKLVPESGIGFVCFTDRDSARKAKETMNLSLRGRELNIAHCEPKESRQKQLEELWDKKAFDR
jgi:polyadenylate-binding protein